MNQIRLTCVERTHWHRGKGFFNVVAPLAPPPPPPTETTTKASPAAAATQSPAPLTSASPTHIEVLADSQQLYVWSLANGCEAFKKNASNSVMSHVLYATSNGTHSGIFFSFNKNKGIGFALVEHCLEKPKHLAAKPTVFTEELAVLLDNVYPAAEKKQKRSKYLPFFSVRSAELRRTSDGDVLAAVLSTLSGDMYVISAVLSSNTWRKWKIDGQFGISPTLWISPTGKEVKLMRCEICAPVNPRLAVEAQSVPLALSVFDRVAADWDNGITTAFAVDAKCVVLREKLFRTNNTMTVTERTFQSQCFHLGAEKEHRFYPYQCFLEVDRDTPLFTIVVPCQTFSCIVHLTYAVGGSELQATCNVLNRCIEPVSIATLPVICPERPTGTRISLVLAQDLKIYACEVFGAMVDVNVQNNNGVINSSEDGNLLNFQVPAKTNKSKAAGEDSGSISFTRLLALRESECMTCNGKVAAFFRVDEAKLFGALPEAAATTRVSTVPDTTRPDGAVRLSECLSKIDSMADSMHLAELPDEVFRTIIPALQFVGSSEQEIFLMQKLYDYLLHIVTPRTEAEWNYLWSLTSILQRVIAKRSASNAIVYTDQFFLKLANTYRRSKFATEEGTELVFDGLRAVISDEMKTLLTQPIKDLRTEAQFLLDGCASQEPLLLLVEEVARRMVDVSMLSNGACVVRPNNGLGACVHAAGTVLLASCFDVPLYVGGERGELRCSATLDSDVSVYMEPRTFSSQHEFECALTLATDLLCIVSDADEARSIDIALTALSVTRRNHCLYAYLQLVTPLITVIAAAQRPDYTEEKAFIECATRMMSNPLGQEMSRTLLLDQSHNLMTRMAYVVSTGGRELNYEVYRLVATAFGAESSLLCTVSLLMHATERVVSAQNNYAAAVAQSLVFRGSQRPSTAVTHNIHECRQRLSEVLTKAMVVLAQMHVLTAYKLEDISSCFLDTIQLSRDLAAAAGSSSQFKGTAASKTVIMCFRLIMLAWYTRLLEESLDDAVRTSEQFPPTGGPLGSINADGTLELHPTVEGSMRLLRIMYALNGSALPAEWMQMKILRMLFCAVDLCHQHPDWSPYFMQILRLSQVGGARLDSLNQDMRQVVSELNEASTYQVSDAQRVASAAVVQQCSLQAEEIVHVMTAQTPSGSGAGGVQNRNAVRFVFSNTIDDGMPAWVHPHVLEGREYCEDWTSNLTAVEMISPMLHEAVSLFCERLTEESARETLLTVTESACTSPELSRPLFEHVCLVKPPVRTHAMIAQSDSPSDIRRVGPLPPSEPEVKMMSSSNTPRRGSAPTSVLHSLSVTAAPALVVKPDIGHLELTSSGEVLAATIATLPPKAETVVDPAARVDCQQPPTSLPEKLASTSKVFTPAEVAWWESVIPPPAAEEDEVRSEVTATSYTTVTTISQRHIDVYQAPTSLEWKRAGDRRHVHVESNSTTSDRQHPYTTTRHTDRCHSRRCRCSRRRTLDAGDVQRQKSKPPMRSSSTAVGMDGGWRTSSGSRNAEARRKADEPLQLLHFHHTMLSPPAAPTGISAAQQPPPQPSSWRRCGSAPVSHRASNDAGLEVPLLQLQGQAASKPKVRLYLPAQTSAGMEIPGLPPSPPLGIPSGSLQPPPLPSSSVFSAPPALLRLPTGTVNTPPRAEHSPPMEAPMTMPAPSTLPSPLEAQMPASQVNLLYPSAVPVHPARTEPAPLPTASGPLPTAAYSQVPRAHETGELSMAHYTNSTIPPPSVRVPIAMPVASPFAQVPRAQEHAGQPYVVPPPVAPVAPWPAAPLAAPSPYAQVPRSEPVTTTPIPSSGPLAQPSASFAPPLTAAPSVTALPSPAAVPSATLSPMNLPLHNSLLNPCEAADFHRYIDELRRGAVPGGSSPSPAVMPSLSVPLRPEATSIAPSVAAAEVPVVGSRQPPSHAGQDEFMYRVETLLQQQSAENANFYRGVREFLHATPARSSGGLSATEQSQLLRTSLKQQSQVADLNHQLLDMQLRQARVEGTQGPTLPSTLDTSVKPLEGLGGDVLRYCSSIVPPHPVEKPLPPSLLATTTTIGGTGPMPAATPLPIPESMGQGTQTQVLTTHDAGVSPRPLDPPAALPSSTASMGMEATMKELVQLNAQIQGVHSSTEAMERALTETQHALGHYRRLGAMEASAAEGEALRTAIRFQTEAAERRLGELLPSTHLPPKIVEPAVPAYPSNVTPLPSGVVTSSSAKAGNATLYSAGTQVPVTSPRIFTDQHSSKCPSSSGEAAATAHNSTTMPPPPPPMADRAQHRRSFMGHSVDAISSNSAPSMVAASPAAASAYWRKDSDALKPLAEVPEPNALPESPVIQPAKECQRVVPPAPAVSLLQVYRSAAHTSAPPHDLIEVKTRQAERRPAARRTATTPNRYSMYRSSPPRNPVSKISTATRSIAPRPQSSHASTSRTHSKAVPSSSILGNAFVSRQTTRRMQSVTECMAMLEQELR